MGASSPPTGPARTDRLRKDAVEDNRTATQRDRDRILYTSAFRRLAGVTQVFAAAEGHVFHNRLTHSLQVAQVARRLAEKLNKEQQREAVALGGLDPEVCEAAALAHDLGHPPFGHMAEITLNDLLTRAGVEDGFEGNAQSFRIVTKLALRFPEAPGLNLTRATLNAILKYPWQRVKGWRSDKWGAYDSEEDELKFARALNPASDLSKGAEAELMDWADDVTYAVHDVEDFYRAGLIPLERLSEDRQERRNFVDSIVSRYQSRGKQLPCTESELREVAEGLLKLFPIGERYTGTRMQRSFLRLFTSELIGRYIWAIRLNVPTRKDEPRVEINPDRKKEVMVWKELTWTYVILNPALATQQLGQRNVVRTLFWVFYRASRRKEFTVFPFAYQDELLAAEKEAPNVKDLNRRRARLVSDFIAGMTEQQAVNLYQRITGISLGSALDPMTR